MLVHARGAVQVIEVHAGMRRTGKDLKELVWEATQSHVVAPCRAPAVTGTAPVPAPAPAASTTPDTSSSSPPPARTRRSSRHAPAAAAVAAEVVDEPPASAAVGPMASSAPLVRASLVLIEDVDVLFEEDRGFWAALEELIDTSKRPVVLTCSGKAPSRVWRRRRKHTLTLTSTMAAAAGGRGEGESQRARPCCGRRSFGGHTRH